MKAWLLQIAVRVRYSYWFVPSVMAIGSAGLAAITVLIDVNQTIEYPYSLQWLVVEDAGGARDMLSTIAGSTVTVAGVVFSMTIMAVSHATSNYGSRLLLRFLKDTQNQITLGTLIGTFIYCLLILRTIKGTGDDSFIPHISLFVGLSLALISVLVLIAFIHHVPGTIHVSTVAEDRGRELRKTIVDFFQDSEKSEPESISELPDSFAHTIRSNTSGYVQLTNVSALREYCVETGILVEVKAQIGDFVMFDEVIVGVNPKSDEDKIDFSAVENKIKSFILIGPARVPTGDPRFLIEELTQVAARSLSPGINDPFSAMTCIDWLGDALSRVVNRLPRPRFLKDDNQEVFLIMPSFTFENMANIIFGQLKSYVTTDVLTSCYVAQLFERLIRVTDGDQHRDILLAHAERFMHDSLAKNTTESDRATLTANYERVLIAQRGAS